MEKCTDLGSIISLTDIKRLTNEHPELMLKDPLELHWKNYMAQELLEIKTEQILIPDVIRTRLIFIFSIHSFYNSLVLLYQGIYHCLSSKQDYWSNQPDLKLRTKVMKQCQEIKQNWTGRERIDIYFLGYLDHWCRRFFFGGETG